MTPAPAILFRCDGDRDLGMGHVSRCLALARRLDTDFGCPVAFAVRRGPAALARVQAAGYPMTTPAVGDGAAGQADWLAGVVAATGARAVVVDVRDDLGPEALLALRGAGVTVAVLDDGSPRRLAADLVFYPPAPHVLEFDWPGFTGEWFADWQWVLLGDTWRPARSAPASPPRILVTLGGSDPHGQTLPVLRALAPLMVRCGVDVVIGPGFAAAPELDHWLAEAGRGVAVHREVGDMTTLMEQATVAVAGFGVTAYELAAAGVPALYLASAADHLRAAEAFEAAGIGRCLGMAGQVGGAELRRSVGALLDDPGLRQQMAAAGRNKVDGQGARRIAEKVLEHVERNRAQAGLRSH